jgi:transcriptional regulator with XRE-family HTH domain
MDYQTVIPKKLRGIRAEHGLKQSEVADAIGKNEMTISNWETGANMMPFDMACELADLYDVPLDKLGGRDERKAD